MDRAKLGVTLIGLDLRNANSRQRTRLTRQSLQALAIHNALREAGYHLRKLRKEISRIERFEARERDAGDTRNPKSKLAGINRRMTGTYGKP